MTDPLRLADELDGSGSLERRVLESATAIAPPPGAKAQVWSVVSAKVGVATAATAAAKGVSVLATMKAVAAGTALGLAATAGATWLFAPSEGTLPPDRSPTVEPRSPPAKSRRNAPVTSPEVNDVIQPSTDRPKLRASEAQPARGNDSDSNLPTNASTPEPRASQGSFPDEPPAAAPSPSAGVDAARFESRRVAEARGLLRAGRAAAALAILGELAKSVPSGVLVQEREALTVEALLGSGDRERARAHARDFLQRYPNSPHTVVVSRALE